MPTAASASQTVTITIHGGNDARRPRTRSTPSSEDQVLTGVNLLANDSDPDGDTLTRVCGLGDPGNPWGPRRSARRLIGATGDLTYTPDANEGGYLS